MNQRSVQAMLVTPAIALVGLFFVVPLGMAIYQSFQRDGGFSLQNYIDLTQVPFSSSITTTLSISVITTVITILVALPACNFVSKRGGWFANIFFLAMALAFTLSILTRTLAWQILLARNGFINSVLMSLGFIPEPIDLLYTRGAVLVSMVQVFIPIAAMVLYAGMQSIDRNLIMASRSLGAGFFQSLRHAYWPQFKGSLVLATLIIFSGTIGSFVMPAVLGGPNDTMFGQLMSTAITNDSMNGAARASAAGIVMIVFLAVVLATGLKIIGKSGAAQAPHLMGRVAHQGGGK